LARDRKLRMPESVYCQVLPDLAPVFEVLQRLASPNVLIRRGAVDDLAKLTAERPLDWLAVDRLSSLALTETDPPVWTGIFRAVAADRSQTSAAIAQTALTHSSPEVRRLACRHLGYLGRPEDVRFLTPALEDSSVVVVRAATQALGVIGDSAAVEPLERLLATANESLRLDASVALAKLDERSGILELERLSFSTDESIRHRVAIAMGQIGDRAFAGQLIRLLDDRHTIRRAALQSLPNVVGHDVTKAPGGQQPSFERQRELWQEWSRRQSTPLAGRSEKRPN
jgi:HEAT repeat protein